MFRTGVGHSEDIDAADATVAAIAEAVAALGGAPPRAALVFTGHGVDPRRVLDTLTARLPGVPHAGCTSIAEQSVRLGAVECSVLIVLLAGDGLEVGAGAGAAGDADLSVARALEQASAGWQGPPVLCVCLADAIAFGLADVQRAVARRLGPDVLVVGGGSVSDLGVAPLRAHEFLNGEVFEGAVVVLLVGGAVAVAHAVGLGWTPVGEPHTATEVVGGNILVALDGRPAADVLHAHLGSAAGAGMSYVHHPFAVDVAGETLLRAPFLPGPTPGSFVLAGDLAVRAQVRFCEFDRHGLLGAAEEAAARALSRWTGPPPRVALVFGCLTLRSALGTALQALNERLRARLPAETALAGVFVGGELAPFAVGQVGHVHNNSIVVVLVGAS